MSTDEIRAAILRSLGRVAPEADLSSLEPDVEFRDQLDIDSFDFVNFIIGLSKATGVDIPEADYPRFATMNKAVAYLASEMNGASPAG
jgi:acyl carrier protein